MTFLQIYTRFLYLIGETDTASITATHKSHINFSIKDILNAYPFSWNLTSASLTLSAGTANLPSTYNPIWRIHDARIVNSSTEDDNIFDEIDIRDRDYFDGTAYKYWITYTAATGIYVFNTPTQTGTVTIYYYTLPADLSADSDVCIIPDGEAVAYLAASKNWIGDERNAQLKDIYEKEAVGRIQTMYSKDLNFNPTVIEYSKVIDNSTLNQRGV